MTSIKFKEKDIVVALPGFNNSDMKSNSGGGGYKVGKIFQIKNTDSYNTKNGEAGYIIWPDDNFSGVYAQACRMATEEEIQAYKEGIKNIKDIIYTYDIY